MTDTFHIEELKNRFEDHDSISVDELHEFYKQFAPDLKRSTLRWRLHELKKNGILRNVKRGSYVFADKRVWEPEISEDLKELFHLVKEKFPYLEFCIWTTRWLVPFSHHLPVKYTTVVDAEMEAFASLYTFLIQDLKLTASISAEEKEINSYLKWKEDKIIVRRLISQAPLMTVHGVTIPKLEKIILDLYADNVSFKVFQGSELKNIYSEIFDRYSVNWSTLKRYAMRRNRWDNFQNYIKNLEINTSFVESE